MMTNETPKIYVACLAAYNAGQLHGQWIDAAQDVDAIMEEIQAMLYESPIAGAEEWAIHDYSGFGPAELGEHEDLAKVAAVAAGIEEHGEAFGLYYNLLCNGEDATSEGFWEAYQGAYNSLEDWAHDLMMDVGDLSGVPDFLISHIDWEGVARDLMMDGYTSEDHGGQVHVFRLG